MKKTITCFAMIASVNAYAKKEADQPQRTPSQNSERQTYVGCRPAFQIYTDKEEYRNNCNIPVQTFKIAAEGLVRPGSTRDVQGCDSNHNLIVSSTPIPFRCLPPGVVEL